MEAQRRGGLKVWGLWRSRGCGGLEVVEVWGYGGLEPYGSGDLKVWRRGLEARSGGCVGMELRRACRHAGREV